MLGSLNNQVSECLRHAEDCVQQAASQADPKLRQDYLIIATCWLKLSYELSDRLADFSKSKSPEPPLGSLRQAQHPLDELQVHWASCRDSDRLSAVNCNRAPYLPKIQIVLCQSWPHQHLRAIDRCGSTVADVVS
jgi:hypothetical protein